MLKAISAKAKILIKVSDRSRKIESKSKIVIERSRQSKVIKNGRAKNKNAIEMAAAIIKSVILIFQNPTQKLKSSA